MSGGRHWGFDVVVGGLRIGFWEDFMLFMMDVL